jgi:ribosomal protein S13
MASTTAIKSEIKEGEGIGSGAEKLPNEDAADKNKIETDPQKLTGTQKVDTEESEFEIIPTNCSEEKKNNTITKEPVQTESKSGKSLVDVALIKESSEKDELAAALQNMPGMTKSKSREILKALDEKEITEIAEQLNEKEEEKEDGSLIDISIVDESETEKEVQEVIKEAEHGFQAEVVDDNEEIEILPADNEEVVEYTIEMKHVIPIISIMVAFIAVFYALMFHYHI